MLTKIISLGSLLALGLVSNVFALVPLEGIVLGKVTESLQVDPLQGVFSTPLEGDGYQQYIFKSYVHLIEEAQQLEQSCSYIGKASYASPNDETIALRTIVANLQYIGIDRAVKSIGAYARYLGFTNEEYQSLVEKLVKGSCSPNISIYSLKLIKQNLYASFKEDGLLINFIGEPYAPSTTISKVSSLDTRENEFNHITKNFRALCSWGGEVENYRLLPPLLANPVVMSFVFRHMESKRLNYNDKTNEISLNNDPGLSRVSCSGALCRSSSADKFEKKFPRMIGSSGLKQDLQRQWCNHFRYQNYLINETQSPIVRDWIKAQEPEDEKKDVAVMVSLLTGVSDLVMGTKNYNELSAMLKEPIDSGWSKWATNSIKNFSTDLYREEPLEFRIEKTPTLSNQNPFQIDLSITMGELDRVLAIQDKLKFEFGIKISRNWLRWARTQAIEAKLADDPAVEQERVVALIADHLKINTTDEMSKNFVYFGDLGQLSFLLSETLIDQLLKYEGNYFDQIQDKMVRLPIRLHYGMFALSYIKHKLRIIRNPAITKPLPVTDASLSKKEGIAGEQSSSLDL